MGQTKPRLEDDTSLRLRGPLTMVMARACGVLDGRGRILGQGCRGTTDDARVLLLMRGAIERVRQDVYDCTDPAELGPRIMLRLSQLCVALDAGEDEERAARLTAEVRPYLEALGMPSQAELDHARGVTAADLAWRESLATPR